MTILPAVVTITDLTLATTLSTAAVFEAVQTTNGVVESVQVQIGQIMTSSLGALPAGGNTGQLLGKSSANNYSTIWENASVFVAANATSGLTVAGSTSLALSLASVVGPAVLGVPATATAIPGAILGTNSLFLGVTAGGTAQFQAINFGTAASFTGVLTVPFGGSGTSTLPANSMLIGAGTAALQVASPSTAGNILIDQGSTTNPAFKVVSGDVAITSTGAVTIGTNVVSYAKIQQGTGLAVLGFATTAAANVTTFVAGAANQVLQVATTGTSIGWGLPAQVLLNTILPNGVATAGDTTSFSSTFKSYLVTFDSVAPANTTAILQLQFATTGTAFLASNYISNVVCFSNQTSGVSIDPTPTSAVILLSGNRSTTNVSGTSVTYGVSGFLRMFNPAGSLSRKMCLGEMSYLNGSSVGTGLIMALPSGFLDTTTPLTGFQVSFTPGNIATGIIKVYGLT